MLVPSPPLVILGVFWNINVTSQLVTGLILNLTVPAGQNTALYNIIVSVSCKNLTSGAQFWCSHGSERVVLPGGATVIIPITLTPQVDPELTEVHDLSFIVTSTPPVPVTPCTNPNCLPRP